MTPISSGLPLATATAMWIAQSGPTTLPPVRTASRRSASARSRTSTWARVRRRAASAAASHSMASLSSMTSRALRRAGRTIPPSSARPPAAPGVAAMKEPRPWKVSTRPSARSWETASRTTVRETS